MGHRRYPNKSSQMIWFENSQNLENLSEHIARIFGNFHRASSPIIGVTPDKPTVGESREFGRLWECLVHLPIRLQLLRRRELSPVSVTSRIFTRDCDKR